MSHNETNKNGWFSQKNLVVLSVACVVFALADLTYKNHHPHVRFETWFNFFGFFAVIAAAILIAAALFVGDMLQREEDYYDE